jgi:hypothetical protein
VEIVAKPSSLHHTQPQPTKHTGQVCDSRNVAASAWAVSLLRDDYARVEVVSVGARRHSAPGARARYRPVAALVGDEVEDRAPRETARVCEID